MPPKDLQDLVHPRQVDRDPALEGRDVPLERRPRSERDHGAAVTRAKLDDLNHLVGAFHEGDRIGRHARVVGFGLPVLFAHGGGGGQAIAQPSAQLLDHRVVVPGHSRCGL
jgi:hypothetical protein